MIPQRLYLFCFVGFLVTNPPLVAQPLLQEPPASPRVLTLKVDAKGETAVFRELAQLLSLGHATDRGEAPRRSTAEVLIRLTAVKEGDVGDLKKAAEAARTEFVTRFKHCWAHALVGNTPERSLQEFKKPVWTSIGGPGISADRRYKDTVKAVDVYLDDILARGRFSRLLEYAQIQSIERQQVLWSKYLIPVAKNGAGKAAENPPLVFDPKANPLRFRVYSVYDLPLANKTGNKLSNVTLRVRVSNEFGDKHDMYYFLPEIREKDVVRLEWSPWWSHWFKAVSRNVALTVDIWATELTHTGYEFQLQSAVAQPSPEVGRPGETFDDVRKRIIATSKTDFAKADKLADDIGRLLPDPVDPIAHRKSVLTAFQPNSVFSGQFPLTKFQLKIVKLVPEKNYAEAEVVTTLIPAERFPMRGTLVTDTNFATAAVFKGTVSVTLAGVTQFEPKFANSKFEVEYAVRLMPDGTMWLNILPDSEVAVTKLVPLPK